MLGGSYGKYGKLLRKSDQARAGVPLTYSRGDAGHRPSGLVMLKSMI